MNYLFYLGDWWDDCHCGPERGLENFLLRIQGQQQMTYTHKLYLFLNSTYPSLHSLTDDLIECCTNLLQLKVYFCLVYNVNFSNILSRDILFIRLCWELYLWSWTKYHIYQRYQRKSYFLCSWKATAASIYRATNNWVFQFNSYSFTRYDNFFQFLQKTRF